MQILLKLTIAAIGASAVAAAPVADEAITGVTTEQQSADFTNTLDKRDPRKSNTQSPRNQKKILYQSSKHLKRDPQRLSVGQPDATFAPGTFGTTFSDGGYVSFGVPHPPAGGALPSYDDQSYTNNGFGGYPPQNSFPGNYYPNAPYPNQPFAQGPPVTVGQDIHTGGDPWRQRHQKRGVESESASEHKTYYPYGYGAPVITVGQPNAYFAPGTFGTTFSDGGYTSWGVPHPYGWRPKLNRRSTETAATAETHPHALLPARFAPGTFGTTWNDGSYTSWGSPSHFGYRPVQRWVAAFEAEAAKAATLATEAATAKLDETRDRNKAGYASFGYDTDWHRKSDYGNPRDSISHRDGFRGAGWRPSQLGETA
jgi:hypothetical protein